MNKTLMNALELSLVLYNVSAGEGLQVVISFSPFVFRLHTTMHTFSSHLKRMLQSSMMYV